MKKCHDCGHEHPTMASATRRLPGEREWQERFFCHENDHSCYQSRYGNYWGDRRVSTVDRMMEIIDEALGRESP